MEHGASVAALAPLHFTDQSITGLPPIHRTSSLESIEARQAPPSAFASKGVGRGDGETTESWRIVSFLLSIEIDKRI